MLLTAFVACDISNDRYVPLPYRLITGRVLSVISYRYTRSTTAFSSLSSRTFQHGTGPHTDRLRLATTKRWTRLPAGQWLAWGGSCDQHVDPVSNSSLLPAVRKAASPYSPSPLDREAIYPRLTGKKLVFIDRLLTANSVISICMFVSVPVSLCTSRCMCPRRPPSTNITPPSDTVCNEILRDTISLD